jgi:hypothetical protein
MKSLPFCVEQGLWQYWFMDALMDFENIKRMSFLIVVLFLKNESPELWSFSPLLAGGRDKTCINNFSAMLKASVHVHNLLQTPTLLNLFSPAIISQWQNHHFKWVEKRWIVEVVTSILFLFGFHLQKFEVF